MMKVLSGLRKKIRKKFMFDEKVYGDSNNFGEFFRLDVLDDLDREDFKEEKELIDKIGRDKIEEFCIKYYLDMDTLTVNLLSILDNDRAFLNYCLNSEKYVNYSILSKLMNGKLDVFDVSSYEIIELKHFKIFKDEVLIGLLNREFEIYDDHYCSINVDSLCREYLPNIDYVNKIHSFIYDKDLIYNNDKLLSVGIDDYVYEKDNISILMPVNDKDIVSKSVFDNYINCSVRLQEGTIVIIGYDRFINLSDEDIDMLKDCVVVLDNDIELLSDICNNLSKKNNYYNNYSNYKEDVIKLNHILYLINNSNLSDRRKKYYSYYIKNIYFNKDFYLFDLNELVSQFVLEVDNEYINRMTDKFNELSFKEKVQDVTQDKYTVDVFLANIENKSIKYILKEVSFLSFDVRNKVLNDNTVKKILRESIIKESKGDPWGYIRDYDGLLDFLSISEVCSLFDGEFLQEAEFKKLIDSNNNKFEYVLFSTMAFKDINQTLNCVLNDEKLYKIFFDKSNLFYSVLVNIDYDLLVKLIYRMEDNNEKYYVNFNIGKKDQYKLLKEGLSDDTLVDLIKRFDNEVKNFFFMNDERAIRLWDKFPVFEYAIQGVRFNEKILNSPEFFLKMKSDSLLEFRKNIDFIYKYNYIPELDNKISKYYDSILRSYDYSSGVFFQYLKQPNINEYNYGNDFILSRDILPKISSFDYIDELRKITNLKISEVVVDGLFSDNIYNVFINIKEMLRYNDHLNENDKVLDDDSIKFYNTVLNIDRIKPEDKIDLYYKLKDKNISLKYYNDIRKLKDLSYDNIKKDMINLEEHIDYINYELSDEKGVLVYDLRDKKYNMLVRCMDEMRDKNSNRRSCYSLIGDTNTNMFASNKFIYGYSNFDNDCVLHVFERDAFSNDFFDESDVTPLPNRIATSDEIINSVGWFSEIQIVNRKDKNGNLFDVMRPSFLVCVDNIRNRDVLESKRLNIPIALIKSNRLMTTNDSLIFDDNDYEKYIGRYESFYEEDIRRQQRLV